jgi:hypothetical protein
VKDAQINAEGLIFLDSIVDTAGTYKRTLTSALNAEGLVLLDEVVEGAYGLTYATGILAGKIILSATTKDGEWYNETGVIIDADEGIKITGNYLGFFYGAAQVGYVFGFGAAQFNVTAAVDKNLFVGAATGTLFLTGQTKIDMDGAYLDASGCEYFDVPQRYSAPTAVEGRIFYSTYLVRFVGYSSGEWRLLDYPA